MAPERRKTTLKEQAKGPTQETPRAAISSLAEQIQTAMSALYDYNSLQLKDPNVKSKRVQGQVQAASGLRKDLSNLCERIVSWMRQCHGILEDFVFIAQTDFGKKPTKDQVDFVRSIKPRTQSTVKELGNLKTSAQSLTRNQLLKQGGKTKSNATKDVSIVGKAQSPITDPNVALETARGAFGRILELLVILEASWRNDDNALGTLLKPGAKKTLQLPSGAGVKDMETYWREYQKILLAAESSIMQSSDALRVDPPLSITAEKMKKTSLLDRIFRIFKKS